MMVNNFNVMRVPALPTETNSPLPVYPDTMLAIPLTPQHLKMIAWRHAQIIEAGGGIQHQQFPAGNLLYIVRKPFRDTPAKQQFGFPAPERTYHRNCNERRRT